jgi:hypothetical protein
VTEISWPLQQRPQLSALANKDATPRQNLPGPRGGLPLTNKVGRAGGEATMAALPIGFRFRLVDTAGSELGVVSYQTPRVAAGETVYLPDGGPASVVEVYDDEEHGREGGVQATLVVDR